MTSEIIQGVEAVETVRAGSSKCGLVLGVKGSAHIDGLKLRVKDVDGRFAKFFAGLPTVGDPVRVDRWDGLRVWRNADEVLPRVQNAIFSRPGEALMINDYTVNLSFLRAVDLQAGIVVPFRQVHNGNSYAINFLRAAKGCLLRLAADYTTDVDLELVIMTRPAGL